MEEAKEISEKHYSSDPINAIDLMYKNNRIEALTKSITDYAQPLKDEIADLKELHKQGCDIIDAQEMELKAKDEVIERVKGQVRFLEDACIDAQDQCDRAGIDTPDSVLKANCNDF